MTWIGGLLPRGQTPGLVGLTSPDAFSGRLGVTVSSHLRYPHANEDQVVFVVDDDLWLATVSGGRAHRLTPGHVPVRNPRFSPSGRQVGLVSGRPGNQDLRVLDLGSGRDCFTWLSALCIQVCGWLDEDHVLVASMYNEALQAFSWLYSVSLDGKLERLLQGPASAADWDPEGRVVLAPPNFRGPEQ